MCTSHSVYQGVRALKLLIQKLLIFSFFCKKMSVCLRGDRCSLLGILIFDFIEFPSVKNLRLGYTRDLSRGFRCCHLRLHLLVFHSFPPLLAPVGCGLYLYLQLSRLINHQNVKAWPEALDMIKMVVFLSLCLQYFNAFLLFFP